MLAQAKDEAVSLLPSAADALLERGVGDYTFLPAPEGLLGRGKFSTVYKVLGLDGKPVSWTCHSMKIVLRRKLIKTVRSQAYTSSPTSPPNSCSAVTRAHTPGSITSTPMSCWGRRMDKDRRSFLPYRYVAPCLGIYILNYRS